MNEVDILKMIKILNIKKDNPKLKVLLKYIDFFEQVCDFILSKPELLNETNEKLSYMSLEQSLELSKGILSNISNTYPKLLTEYKENGTLKVIDNSGEKMGYGHVSKSKDGKVEMVCGVHLDINDVYLIIHEFMHSLNAQGEGNIDRETLTEGFAIFSEILTNNYLHKTDLNHNEINAFNKIRMREFYKRASGLKEQISIIKYILRNINISDELNEKANSIHTSIFEEDGLVWNIQYTLGNIIALILYSRSEKGLLSSEYYKTLNENINSSSEYEVFNELFPQGFNINELIDGFNRVCQMISNSELSR